LEDLLAECGLDIFCEDVRRWFLNVGTKIAHNLRRRRPTPSDFWHLDEMVIVIRGRRDWLWCVVDNEGEVPGFIILGIATPSEAATFGVLGVVILAAVFRLLDWATLRKSFSATVKVTGIVFLIIMNSAVFSQLLSFSGASSGMLNWATGFDAPVVAMILLMWATLLLLGMFMDPVSMMLISAPIFFPLALALGLSPIWFGIFVLLSLEMSGTTPPFGMLLFIMLGVAPKGTTLFQVASAAFPFLVCDAILILLMIAFPELVLFLPNLMR